MSSIKGSYCDGDTSQQIDTVLRWSEKGELIFEGSSLPTVAFSDIKISSRIGNTPRYFEMPDGGVFETCDNDAVDQLIDTLSGSRQHNFIYFLENSRKFIFMTLLAVVLIGWGFIQFGIPAMSRYIAMIVPEEQIHYLGIDVLSSMDEHIFSPSTLDEDEQLRLSGLFSGIIAGLGKKNIHVQFRHSESIGANAFALPDGSIVFTDDLVRLSDTDGELIAVLLHEIGHLHHRHSLRMAIQGFSLAAFVAIITGDVSTSSTIITGLPALLIQSGYSREMETEADDYSLDYMLNNNISPGNFASILSRIEYSHSIDYERCIQDEKSVQACLQEMGPETSLNEEKSYSVQDFLSSHPGTSDRIHRFQHL